MIMVTSLKVFFSVAFKILYLSSCSFTMCLGKIPTWGVVGFLNHGLVLFLNSGTFSAIVSSNRFFASLFTSFSSGTDQIYGTLFLSVLHVTKPLHFQFLCLSSVFWIISSLLFSNTLILSSAVPNMLL